MESRLVDMEKDCDRAIVQVSEGAHTTKRKTWTPALEHRYAWRQLISNQVRVCFILR